MKTIHIKDFCETKGNSQALAGELLGIHQTAVSKMIRTGRQVYLEFAEDGQFIRAHERRDLSGKNKVA